MADNEKKYLDLVGLTKYDELIKGIMNSADAVVLASAKAHAEGLASANSANISANASAIAVLNGEKTVEGSVKKQIADAIDSVIGGAPSAFDTFKEISDWISAHGNSAAEMLSAINANASAISAEAVRAESAETEIQGNIDALFKDDNGTYTGTIKTFVDSAVANANADATSAIASAVAKAENDLTTKIEGLDSVVSGADADGHVTVTVSEADGLLTGVTVAVDNIAKADALSAETSARESAVTAEYNRASAKESAIEVALTSAIAKEVTDRDSAITVAINALDSTVSAVAGDLGITIVETDGKLASVTIANSFTRITEDEIGNLFSATV